MLGREGDYAQWLFLIFLSFAGAALWAAITWPYMRGVNERLERGAKEAARKHLRRQARPGLGQNLPFD